MNRGDNDGDGEGGMVNCDDDDDGAGGDEQTTRGPRIVVRAATDGGR